MVSKTGKHIGPGEVATASQPKRVNNIDLELGVPPIATTSPLMAVTSLGYLLYIGNAL